MCSVSIELIHVSIKALDSSMSMSTLTLVGSSSLPVRATINLKRLRKKTAQEAKTQLMRILNLNDHTLINTQARTIALIKLMTCPS